MPPQSVAMPSCIKQFVGVIDSVHDETSPDNIGERNMTAERRERVTSVVFVLDSDKMPLDMCHPAKARKLLREGRAAIYRKEPFTIILKQRVVDHPKRDYRLKIDYGSRHTGLAILKGEDVCWLGQLEHRTDIQKNLLQRRGYRKRRRKANLRYRKPRFSNRTRPEGWLPPSLQSCVNNIHTFVSRLMRLVPLGAISYENVKFDTQLLQNPDICGMQYQQGALAGYEVREYLLEKFQRKCVYCGLENVPMEVEHLTPRSRGGTNRIGNLAIACHACNQAKGNMTAEEFGFPELRKQARQSLKDAAIITATHWAVYRVLESFGFSLECGTGGRTKLNRVAFDLPKEHYYDAVCVGASTPGNLYVRTKSVQFIKAVGRGSHQRTNVNASGFPRGNFARQKRFFGFQTGDLVRAIIPKGKKTGVYVGVVACRKSGSFDIKTKAGRVQGLNHKYFTLIQRADGYKYFTERCCAIPSQHLKKGTSMA